MAEFGTVTVKVNAAGLDLLAEIIAHLHAKNQELASALTAVQTESTRQVEQIRALKRQIQAGAGVAPGAAGERE